MVSLNLVRAKILRTPLWDSFSEDDDEDEDEDDYDYEEEAEIPVNDIRVSACTVRDAEPDHWATFLEAEEDYDDDDYEDYDEEDDEDNFHEELWNSRFYLL